MALYEKGKPLSGGTLLKRQLHDFPGGELAKARILLVDSPAAPSELEVQFNPQSLQFSGSSTASAIPAAGKDTPGAFNHDTSARISMNVELLFDAINDAGPMALIKAEGYSSFAQKSLLKAAKGVVNNLGSGALTFPEAYDDISAKIDFFYNIMASPERRRIRFAWNLLAFEGLVENTEVNITLFDVYGSPTRATVRLTVSDHMEPPAKSGTAVAALPSVADLETRLRP